MATEETHEEYLARYEGYKAEARQRAEQRAMEARARAQSALTDAFVERYEYPEDYLREALRLYEKRKKRIDASNPQPGETMAAYTERVIRAAGLA